MRSTAALIAILCSGCAGPIQCRPEFVIKWWEPPLSVPAGDRLADIKSVTLIHCKE